MKKRWVKGLLPLLCLLLTASCTGNGAAPNGTDSTSVESTGTSGENAALPDLTVTVISIGKADAILVEAEGHSLLIDTGEEAAWELKRTLKAKDLLSDRAQEGTTTLYASDQPEDFGLMAKHFLQEELTSPVLQVNIDRY